MNKEDFLFCGKIRKVSGYKGEVVAVLEKSLSGEFEKQEFVFIETPFGLVPYEVESIRPSGNDAFTVKFTDINNEKEAIAIRDNKLYIPFSEIDIPEDDQMIIAGILKGFKVKDRKYGIIGIVISIIDMKEQSLLEVERNGKTHLIPLVQAMIEKFDHKNRVIHTHLPEGLLEINEE